MLHAHLINLWSLISGRWLHLKRYTKSNDLISPDTIMIKHLASKITYWKKIKIAVHCSQGRNIAQMLRGFMLFIFDLHGKWRDCKFLETHELLYFRWGDWEFFYWRFIELCMWFVEIIKKILVGVLERINYFKSVFLFENILK